MASGPISSVQSLSRVWLFETPWTTASQGSLSITNSQNLLKLFSIELVMPSKHLVLCCPLLLPSVFPSIRVFSNESVLHIRGPKYWRFSFNISPSNEYSGLISFSMDWLDLLAVWGTLKSLLQHHSSKASIVQRSAFLIVQKQLLNQQKPTAHQSSGLLPHLWYLSHCKCTVLQLEAVLLQRPILIHCGEMHEALLSWGTCYMISSRLNS